MKTILITLISIYFIIEFSVAHITELSNGLKLNYTYESMINEDSSVVSWSFGKFVGPKNKSVEFDLRFFSPTAPGAYPVIIFLTGLDGIAPGFFYIDLLNKLTDETQSIIVCFDRIHFPRFPNVEEKWFEKTLNWTLINLDSLFNTEKTPKKIKGQVFPDIKTNGISLMSHSAAAHPIVAYLNSTCGMIKNLILLDPVDGYDPFGLIKIFITNPPKQLPFYIPTLIIETGLDNTPKSSKVPPCAPANFSNSRFYDSLSGPTWMLNFTNYGHADILDDLARKVFSDSLCVPCEKDCLFDLYRTNVARALTLFIKAVNEKNAIFLNAIQNPTESKMFDENIKILSVYKTNGFDILNTGSFCTHNNNKSNFFKNYFKTLFSKF